MKRLMTLLLALLLLSAVASAQRNDRHGDRKERSEKRVKQVVKALELDDATAEWFKPIYTEMQDTLRATQQAVAKMAAEAQRDGGLTDAKAHELLSARFAADAKSLSLKHAYCTRLSERLTPRQLYKLFSMPTGGAVRQPVQRGDGFPPGGPGFPPPGGFHGGGF